MGALNFKSSLNTEVVIRLDATAHDVSKKFCCQKFRAKGSNTYQVIHVGAYA